MLGPCYDLLKHLKLSLQAELNAPAMREGSTILVPHCVNINYQLQNMTKREAPRRA